MIATGLRAQEILGTWQGTVAVAKPGRVVLRVTKDETGALRASSYRPGTGLNVVPMTSFTFTPPMVTTAQAYAGMKFEGKLSGDGKSITGTWTEGKQISPLTLSLVTGDEIWKPDYAGQASMAADADPSFDVATIKPTSPNQQMRGMVCGRGTSRRSTKASATWSVLLITCRRGRLKVPLPGRLRSTLMWQVSQTCRGSQARRSTG